MTTDTPHTLPDGRPIPLMTGPELPMLESWLEFHRATLALKCAGLDDAQARVASVEPSSLTLLGLVQHLAEVERNWFQRVIGGLELPPVFDGDASGYVLDPARTLDEAPFTGTEVSLRWVFIHMIEEYARHNGHADLLRERIDGVTGA
ncbi:DinB family protein [Streptomyces justiciae]|uniref:DinB family protein n=1 Tax=Streptomyces justiciae TaxID=2780140 RepID=UPI00187EB2DE|nr:DinB family protein [Streptomyces justiciae]MBE8473207.1 DinB family protein [Streptomyces justiciae]